MNTSIDSTQQSIIIMTERQKQIRAIGLEFEEKMKEWSSRVNGDTTAVVSAIHFWLSPAGQQDLRQFRAHKQQQDYPKADESQGLGVKMSRQGSRSVSLIMDNPEENGFDNGTSLPAQQAVKISKENSHGIDSPQYFGSNQPIIEEIDVGGGHQHVASSADAFVDKVPTSLSIQEPSLLLLSQAAISNMVAQHPHQEQKDQTVIQSKNVITENVILQLSQSSEESKVRPTIIFNIRSRKASKFAPIQEMRRKYELIKERRILTDVIPKLRKIEKQ